MKYYNWGNISKSVTYQNIITDWVNLLNNNCLKEADYHKFLSENPYFFLTPIDTYLVISKLKLGSEYETDFVMVKEGYSDGTIYELIEIESPHAKLFDKSGKPTATFNSALQQILDWKRFLKNDKHFFRKFLPTTNAKIINESRIEFKLIIGRRSENQEELEKRRQYAEEYKIKIISYDQLSEIAQSRKIFPNEPLISSGQTHFLEDINKKNQLANPFFSCINDSTWKTICRAGHTKHFYTNYLDSILEARKYSKYFDDFTKEKINILPEIGIV
ncbi:DUF4263 domain-containing protein [Arcicella aquatica]|uniref:DUF4263 domain-containing protein n=1 Tax=Arcicella aquatica TaxID=217141 RepID=A0ABU5QMH4_9BACT|nr:Shedu anti-phage system protein SduA domain-containing protein [Arcicella aquatica]MEA5258125.1 DUF4263 domain-containing protein [Arcicella aquatica]